MYLLAILLPPLAVWIRKGFLAALLNLVLSLFGFIPGVIHALIVVASTDADKRTEKLEKKLGQLIDLHDTKDNKKAEKPIEAPVKKGIDWSKVFTLTSFAWLFTFGLFARTFESLLDGEFLKSVLFIATAAMIAPPTWKALREKSDKMTRNVAAVITVVLVLASSANAEEKSANPTVSPPPVPKYQNEVQAPSPKPSLTPKSTQSPTSTPKTINKPKPSPTPTEVSKPIIETAPSETVSQRNAVRSAKSYLAYAGFSHDGLVAQLEYEKFSHDDAVYGADNSGADWNEQAAKSAKSYMEYSAFSRDSLIEQLKHEKFTQAQAEFGANSVGL